MAALELRVDISSLIDAVISGNNNNIISSASALLEQERNADVLLGRIGLLASKGDTDGQATITTAAAAMLARFLRARPAPLDQTQPSNVRALPLFVRAIQIAAPAVRKGNDVQIEEPQPFFPSEQIDQQKTINTVLNEAILNNDVIMAERVLLGFYGTGADYRTLQVRTYESISTTFANNGQQLIDAVRGFQLLDALEWSKSVPTLLHWLAPRLVQSKNAQEPAWITDVRNFAEANSLVSIRTRLSAPQNVNALAVHKIILSNADTKQVLQSVKDAALTGEAQPRAIASVIALAAADLLMKIESGDRELFLRAANGLLYASAARNVFSQVQDVEVYQLLYTTAAYINALYKEVGLNKNAQLPAPAGTSVGGGLIAASQLETLEQQLKAKDYAGALSTGNRYLKLGHDARALFGTISLGVASNDQMSDHARSLQIVQAAGEEFVNWPKDLPETNIQSFLHTALGTAIKEKRG